MDRWESIMESSGRKGVRDVRAEEGGNNWKYGHQSPKLVRTASGSGPSGCACCLHHQHPHQLPFSGIVDYFNDDVDGGFGCCGVYGSSSTYGGDGRIMTTYIPFLFTPAQWQELKRQAFIYKHLVSSVPIPVHLLLYDPTAVRSLYPTRNIPEEAVIGRSHRFKNNADQEPGRCRRTDGKKWRCSRDVATDQKYCERHMHRGRARSRKHVEQPREKLTTEAAISTGTSTGTCIVSGTDTAGRDGLPSKKDSRYMDWMRGGAGGDNSDQSGYCSLGFIQNPTKTENTSSLPSNLTLSMSNTTSADPDPSSSTTHRIQIGMGVIDIGLGRAHPLGGPLGEVFQSATSTSSPRSDDVSSSVRLNM